MVTSVYHESDARERPGELRSANGRTASQQQSKAGAPPPAPGVLAVFAIETCSRLDGDAVTLSGKQHPTQADLQALADARRGSIKSIKLHPEYDFDSPPLDFEAIGGLPLLQELDLHSINLAAIRFSSQNTPELRTLTLSNVVNSAQLHLDLPHLWHLEVHHTFCSGPRNAFGASLSRCPMLQNVNTYKFKFLQGRNYCLLPRCQDLRIERAECMTFCEVLHAPLLSEVDMEGAYSLTHFRLRDLPAATREDALRLNASGLSRAQRVQLLKDVRSRAAPPPPEHTGDTDDDIEVAPNGLAMCTIKMAYKGEPLSSASMKQLGNSDRVQFEGLPAESSEDEELESSDEEGLVFGGSCGKEFYSTALYRSGPLS